MLKTVLFELSLFGRGDDRDLAETDLVWLLEALTQRDQAYLRDHPDTPRLYRSGVVYERPKQMLGEAEETAVLRWALDAKRARHPSVQAVLKRVQEVFGGEHFADIGVILKKGRHDCDGLAAFRSAELRQRGIGASPYITSKERPDGGTTYHVIVRWPDGSSEDPSLLLGMGGASRAADRAEEIRKNRERCEIIERAGGRGWRPRLVRGGAPTVVDFGHAGLAGNFGVDAADIDRALAGLRRAA